MYNLLCSIVNFALEFFHKFNPTVFFFFFPIFAFIALFVVVYGRFDVKEALGLEWMGLTVILEMVGSCDGVCKSTTL